MYIYNWSNKIKYDTEKKKWGRKDTIQKREKTLQNIPFESLFLISRGV